MSFEGVISIEAIASALPDSVVSNDFFGSEGASSSAAQKKMFLGTKLRRHVSRDEMSVDLFEKAARKIEDETGLNLKTDVDAIVTNVSLPDMPFTGCGAILAQRLGIKPKLVLDLHNGGCISFLLLADFAQSLMKTHGLKRVLVGISQTAAGRIFAHPDIRKKPQSAIPGDGAAVVLFTLGGDCPISPISIQCHPEFASDMTITSNDGHHYWEPSAQPSYIDFPEAKISTILMRGNRIVPAAMRELLKLANLKPSAIDGLITNQPNEFFLRNWREAVEVPKEKHFETFELYGNLFQAGIPVNLDHAIRNGQIKSKMKILLAGFSHAGDYSGAALLHWKMSG